MRRHECGGGGAGRNSGIELQAMIAVVGLFAGRGDPLSSRNHRGMADSCYQVAVTAGFNPQDAEATFLAVKRDPFNITNKNFRG